MRRDLSRVRIEREPEPLHKTARERRPVDAGVRDQVRVVISHGAIELASAPHAGYAHARTAQARSKIGHLLAQRSGCGRLAVRARQHRHICQFVG
jgi:hypothetical protein